MSLVKKLMYWRMFGKNHAEKIVAEEENKLVIDSAKAKRKEAEKRIDNMIAQINGCGDRWFLKPVETLDECVPRDTNGG